MMSKSKKRVKYKSLVVCKMCGRQTNEVLKGWIGYYCGDCAEKLNIYRNLLGRENKNG